MATIMNIFSQVTLNDINEFSINQYKSWLYHALNQLSGLRQGDIQFSYDQKSEVDINRDRLKQLQAEADARTLNKER